MSYIGRNHLLFSFAHFDLLSIFFFKSYFSCAENYTPSKIAYPRRTFIRNTLNISSHSQRFFRKTDCRRELFCRRIRVMITIDLHRRTRFIDRDEITATHPSAITSVGGDMSIFLPRRAAVTRIFRFSIFENAVRTYNADVSRLLLQDYTSQKLYNARPLYVYSQYYVIIGTSARARACVGTARPGTICAN